MRDSLCRGVRELFYREVAETQQGTLGELGPHFFPLYFAIEDVGGDGLLLAGEIVAAYVGGLAAVARIAVGVLANEEDVAILKAEGIGVLRRVGAARRGKVFKAYLQRAARRDVETAVDEQVFVNLMGEYAVVLLP